MLIIGIISILYFFIITAFFVGWIKIDSKIDNSVEFTILTVLIAAKNEENNIEKILLDIENQKYPRDKFEVIIIDDNSTDKTSQIVDKICKLNDNFKLLKLVGETGKKAAIQYGINNAKGKLIITTDADCRVGEKWLKSINEYYVTTNAKMIIAPVVYDSNKKILSFANYQSLEFMSLTASTAGAVGLNSPIMCNGANLIFEKKVFYEFENPHKSELASGDDVFLMLNIKRKYPRQIKYLKNIDAVVFTKPSSSLKSFVNQRIRWASKSTHYNDFFVNFVGIIVLLLNLALFVTFFGAIFQVLAWKLFLLLLITKSIADFPLLFVVSKFFSKQKLMFLFLPLQIVYFFYVVIIGIMSFFVKFRWK